MCTLWISAYLHSVFHCFINCSFPFSQATELEEPFWKGNAPNPGANQSFTGKMWDTGK